CLYLSVLLRSVEGPAEVCRDRNRKQRLGLSKLRPDGRNDDRSLIESGHWTASKSGQHNRTTVHLGGKKGRKEEMTNRIGGDLGDLQNLESSLRRRGQDIQGVRSEISNLIQNTFWVGPSAERFKDEWSSQYAGLLQKLEQALGDLAGEVQRRREQLQQMG